MQLVGGLGEGGGQLLVNPDLAFLIHQPTPARQNTVRSAQTASIIDVSPSSVYVIFLPNLTGGENRSGVRKPDARWQSCRAAGMRTEKKAVGVLNTNSRAAAACWALRTVRVKCGLSGLAVSRLEVDTSPGGRGGMNGRGARYEANSQYEYWQVIRTRPEPLTAGLCDAILRDGPAEPPGCRRCTVRDISDIKTEIISLMLKLN